MTTFEDIENEVRSESGEAQKETPAPGFTSIGDLLNEPEEQISWVIEGLLPSAGFSALAAKPKVGKTHLARQAGFAVARGDPFLGRETTKGVVLYLALEEKRSEMRKHLRMLTDVYGPAERENLHVFVAAAPEKAQAWLEREIKARKPILVIIDTLFRFARVENGNDYVQVTAALTPILSLARESGAHLMVVHHAGKGGGQGGDAILGSTAIFGSVDTAIILRKNENNRTIETLQRYGTDMESTVLLFDESTHVTSLGGKKEEEDANQISEAMLLYLDSQPEPVDETTINTEVEGRTKLKRTALRQLVRSGAVTRTGKGVSGNPYLYSRTLVPDIYAGQEKQEAQTTEKPNDTGDFSRSQGSVDSLPF